MAMTEPGCSKRIYSDARWDFNGHMCLRKGVVQTENGKWWCRQHSPEGEAARNAKKDAKARAEREREDALTKTAEDLRARLGMGQRYITPFTHKLTDSLVLSRREVEALLARLEEK